jgi:hypothetical protein
MQTVQHPRQPNLQDKKGQHDGDHLWYMERKGFPKNDYRYERFEALIQSQRTIATLDTTPTLDETRCQIATHRTQADAHPDKSRAPNQQCGTSCRHTSSEEATHGFRRAKQRPSISKSPAPVKRVIQPLLQDILGDDGSAVGNQEQEKELSDSCRIHTLWAPESVRVSAHL